MELSALGNRIGLLKSVLAETVFDNRDLPFVIDIKTEIIFQRAGTPAHPLEGRRSVIHPGEAAAAEHLHGQIDERLNQVFSIDPARSQW